MTTKPSIPADRQIVPASPAPSSAAPLTGQNPDKQLFDLPRDELAHLCEELGLDCTAYKTPQHMVAAIHQRRQLIAALDREAMLDVVRWGRRPVSINAGKDHLAVEIARIKSMKFAGLSQRGLLTLALLRGVGASDSDPVPVLIRKLKKKEGIFRRFNRKRRSFLGSLVANLIGDNLSAQDYKFLPPTPGGEGASGGSSATLREDIEEAGLIGGISSRLKKTADQYLNQKLDEIEARIDRKLDDIDRRLTEWRDKEIANRIRILKITLWASVIVGIVSLIYSYVMTYIVK